MDTISTINTINSSNKFYDLCHFNCVDVEITQEDWDNSVPSEQFICSSQQYNTNTTSTTNTTTMTSTTFRFVDPLDEDFIPITEIS